MACLFLKSGRNCRKVKIPKNVLGSSLGEGGFECSETKEDKRTAPRPKFLFRLDEYRNKGRNPEKLP
jgi:hypothetical protein